MAKATGSANHPVIADLLKRPRRYSFFQAVRLLERHTRGLRMGYQGPPRQEPMRFRALDSLSFPGCDLEQIDEEENPWGKPERRYQLTGTFLGLYGPASPLPANYTEMIVQYSDAYTEEDRARLRAFVDVFHHRFFSLFYRCQSKYRYHFLYELGGLDKFSYHMHCLIGRGTSGMPKDRPIESYIMIRYAGLLTQQPRSGEGLRGVIADFFAPTRVRVQQCVGRWLNVEGTNSLGQANCGLGSDMILGSQVHDRMGKFRVSLGPVGFKDFLEFLPNGKRMGQLKELVRLYLLDELDFDVEIWLRGDEVPPTVMSSKGLAPMLGWTTFVVDRPGPDRAIVFNPR